MGSLCCHSKWSTLLGISWALTSTPLAEELNPSLGAEIESSDTAVADVWRQNFLYSLHEMSSVGTAGFTDCLMKFATNTSSCHQTSTNSWNANQLVTVLDTFLLVFFFLSYCVYQHFCVPTLIKNYRASTIYKVISTTESFLGDSLFFLSPLSFL